MTSISDSQAAALQGRRVAVTGAASGIGAATAKRLQAFGCRVACLDRNIAGARATGDAKGIAIEVDVADETSVIRAFREAGNAWGGLDALVTAAGIINTTPFRDDGRAIPPALRHQRDRLLLERARRLQIYGARRAHLHGGEHLELHPAAAMSRGAPMPRAKVPCSR